jgi:ubiquinone/menaquinone biosynthesis C-methylase UbiE
LDNCDSWLDVACGTGFILSQFQGINKTGLDISPAMLEVARKKNPDVPFVLGNFLDEFPEWEGKWDLVSCMWWSYTLVESITEIRTLISNMARWTSEKGTCVVPLCNPQKLDSKNINIPYVDSKVSGKIFITGITWSWIQENGKRHDDMVSPQVEHMVLMFKEFFHDVEIIEGPLGQIGEGWRVHDILVASRKKNKRTLEPLLNYDLFKYKEQKVKSFPGQSYQAVKNYLLQIYNKSIELIKK